MANPLGMATWSTAVISAAPISTPASTTTGNGPTCRHIGTPLSRPARRRRAFQRQPDPQSCGQWIDAQQPRSAAEQLRLFLLKEAHDSEFVLDLHCDSDSLLHIFTSPELMPELQDLADWMGAAAVLTAADSGGGSFDEVLPLLYRKMAQTNPGKPVPMASATATLEYRGHADSFDHYGEQDALRLFGFLAGRGLIEANPGPKPDSDRNGYAVRGDRNRPRAERRALAYRVDLAQRVQRGQPIADLIALDGPKPSSAAPRSWRAPMALCCRARTEICGARREGRQDRGHRAA